MKWISGFRHFLYWLCSQARYSLRRLERLSRFVWGWLRYTPVRKRRVYLLYCSCLLTYLLVLGIKPGQVYAQEDTPTPTNQPIYVTPTPEVKDFTCPGTQPQGWGEVTPSAYWNLNCAQCVTPVSQYTWPTLDPDIWGTPEPTDIVDITQYEGLYLDDVNSELRLYNDETKTIHNDNGRWAYTGDWWNLYDNQSGRSTTSSIRIQKTFTTSSSTTWSRSFELRNYTDAKIYVQIMGEYELIELEAGEFIVIRSYAGSFPGTFNQDMILIVYIEQSDNGANFAFRDTSITGLNVYGVYDVEIKFQNHIWVDPIEPINSYCSTVVSEGAGQGGEGEDTFQLPGINIGVADCVTVAGITVPLDWTDTLFGTGWEDWNLPGMQICFTPIDFGTLTIFGITIDLDLIALGMAGVVLIRLITRS